jgi:hypothetical protein
MKRGNVGRSGGMCFLAWPAFSSDFSTSPFRGWPLTSLCTSASLVLVMVGVGVFVLTFSPFTL